MLLVFVLVCSNFVSNWPEILPIVSHFAGTAAGLVDSVGVDRMLFRMVRGAVLIAVIGYMAYNFILLRRPTYLSTTTLIALVGSLFWVAACALYAATFKDLPLRVPLLGLYTYAFVPVVLAGWAIGYRHGQYALIRFAFRLRWYLLLSLVIGAMEAVASLGRARSLIGGPVAGATTNANAFGALVVACGTWFLVSRMSEEASFGRKTFMLWILLCVFGSLLSGSRAAIALMIFVASIAMFSIRSVAAKLRYFLVVPLVVVIIGLIIRDPRVMGRDSTQTAKSTAARVQIWEDVVNRFETPGDLIFGAGLGMYSPAAISTFGREQALVSKSAHSAYAGIGIDFGVVGLIGYLLCFVVSLFRGARLEMAVFVTVVGGMSIPFTIWSAFPANVLFLFLWGILLGMGVDRKGRIVRSVKGAVRHGTGFSGTAGRVFRTSGTLSQPPQGGE